MEEAPVDLQEQEEHGRSPGRELLLDARVPLALVRVPRLLDEIKGQVEDACAARGAPTAVVYVHGDVGGQVQQEVGRELLVLA
eukprot:10289962-Alexandrium_andersonii.AAC.1